MRTPALRERVLGVAVGMLADEGAAGFTTRKVARGAETSVPAVYELFGDKVGLVREVYFEGFRKLRRSFDSLEESADARADLLALVEGFRVFVRENAKLAEVMFSRPFAEFDAGPEETSAAGSVREFILARVRRCIDAGVLQGDATDIAHVLLALAQGLVAQETAGWLGTSNASVNRRWKLGFEAVLAGLSAPAPARSRVRPSTARKVRRPSG